MTSLNLAPGSWMMTTLIKMTISTKMMMMITTMMTMNMIMKKEVAIWTLNLKVGLSVCTYGVGQKNAPLPTVSK